MAKRKTPSSNTRTPKKARARTAARRKPSAEELRAAQRSAFLEALASFGTVRHACEAADVGRSTVYEWREEDADFAAAWDAALEEAADTLEREAMRRAAEGVDKPVFQGGALVGFVREYSDTLLIFLLKGLRPEKYRERVDTRGRMSHSFESEPEDVLEGAQKRARLKVVPLRKAQ